MEYRYILVADIQKCTRTHTPQFSFLKISGEGRVLEAAEVEE